MNNRWGMKNWRVLQERWPIVLDEWQYLTKAVQVEKSLLGSQFKGTAQYGGEIMVGELEAVGHS